LIALAVVGVVGAIVLGAIQMGAWLWPEGHQLTVSKPVGGTIVGAGIRCGTAGEVCATTLAAGEMVELQANADPDYVWSGFTGDCAPVGRMAMSRARTCGATFAAVATPSAVTWPLTITKPTGGTILAAGDIMCGTLGSSCSANVPDGQPVTLRFETDAGHRFVSFTDDCAPSGDTTMTTARTCGAVFAPTGTTTTAADVVPGPPQPKKPEVVVKVAPPPPPPRDTTGTPGATGTPSGTGTSVATGTPGGAGTETTTIPTAPNDGKQALPPETAEAHATAEIQQLVKQYCLELETLKPDRVQKVFPQVNRSTLAAQFREYKSLKCAVTEPKFDRLDARPAGGAQVKVDMKQTIQMKVGGQPKVYETIVTIVVSRIDLRSPWFIDRVNAEEKPKP
jgi:hypothetical protein